MVRIAAVLILLLVACIGCRQDSAQWKLAAGLNEHKQGNLDAAIALLQEGLKLDPDAVGIKLRLAAMMAENGQGDLGLAWCDEVLELYPENKSARTIRAECLQYLGRFDEAFREYQNVVAGKIDKTADQLNNLAYFRALANRELDKASRQIESAIEKYERNATWAGMRGVPIHVQTAVSSGLLARHVQGYEYIMEPLNDLIVQHEDLWWIFDSKISRLLKAQELTNVTEGMTSQQFQPAIDNNSTQLENIQASMAFLLATRCLIAEDLGQTELADRDRRWIKKVGFQPQEIFDRLPTEIECLETINVGMMFLDTRGYIATKLPWETVWTDTLGNEIKLPIATDQKLIKRSNYVDALFDLDLSIAAAEINRLAVSSSLLNQLELNLDNVRLRQQQAGKLVAVLRYHRLKAHEKAGQFEQAAADQQCIESLGFEADCSLF